MKERRVLYEGSTIAWTSPVGRDIVSVLFIVVLGKSERKDGVSDLSRTGYEERRCELWVMIGGEILDQSVVGEFDNGRHNDRNCREQDLLALYIPLRT